MIVTDVDTGLISDLPVSHCIVGCHCPLCYC